MHTVPQSIDRPDVINPSGQGPIVLLCEHASNGIPDRYDNLGLSSEDKEGHAAWDPGAYDLAISLSREFDAPLIASSVSRLVYDCNRPPDAVSAMLAQSEWIAVPGNENITEAERVLRIKTVYEPFCRAVREILGQRKQDGTAVVTIHSFTPVFFGERRTAEIGLLHDTDARLAEAMFTYADRVSHRRICLNEPYAASDGVTHSLKKHAVDRGFANVMIEVRNDLLQTRAGIKGINNGIVAVLAPALKDIGCMEVQNE